jgi:hypothetical protein
MRFGHRLQTVQRQRRRQTAEDTAAFERPSTRLGPAPKRLPCRGFEWLGWQTN